MWRRESQWEVAAWALFLLVSLPSPVRGARHLMDDAPTAAAVAANATRAPPRGNAPDATAVQVQSTSEAGAGDGSVPPGVGMGIASAEHATLAAIAVFIAVACLALLVKRARDAILLARLEASDASERRSHRSSGVMQKCGCMGGADDVVAYDGANDENASSWRGVVPGGDRESFSSSPASTSGGGSPNTSERGSPDTSQTLLRRGQSSGASAAGAAALFGSGTLRRWFFGRSVGGPEGDGGAFGRGGGSIAPTARRPLTRAPMPSAFAVGFSSESVGGGRTGAETDGEARRVVGGDGTGGGPAAEAEAAPVDSRESTDAERMPPPPPRLSNVILLPPLPASEEAIRAQNAAARSRPATPEGQLLPAPGFNFVGGVSGVVAAQPQPRRPVGDSPAVPRDGRGPGPAVIAVSTPGWGTPGRGPGDTCSICLSRMPEGLSEEEKRHGPERQRRLRCGHVFHGECIDAWAAKHPTCPLCVHPISPQPTRRDERSGAAP